MSRQVSSVFWWLKPVCRDNGKENGSYCIIIGYILGYIRVILSKVFSVVEPSKIIFLI